MSFYSTLYNTIFKRNSVFVGTVFASAFLFQATFDEAVTAWYENRNKGKLWKDVKVQLAAGGDAGGDADDDE
ncbi:qcr9 subunit 9 of the ubiquinol cytochrome-c reductase complex [Brettanomyces nanus]|uniref:Complex III subunit 9 n=1 Tax=Eeniella nana TaxID=13502 RepID=A0A875S083_EENNA|nr:qcr9 subunit 9 of the ubiquinol cytochrome-c reductase complex [Brettanomyces nanus]QPG75191.1 qcr9 subunit 9 of the ubiquinol cytochrome-c reductase complex [Brettanomyces nanus]